MRAGLVTGAASGIGRATAIAFGATGASVVVSDLESRRSDGEETARAVTDTRGDATFVACDVAVPEQCRALVDATLAAYGRLDFAHNNAGIDHSAPIVETEDADFERVLRVNLWGVWSGMQAQIPAMIEGGGEAMNAICPAAVRTGITDKLPPEIHDVLPEIQAIKRYAEPEEIAAAVVWLCSDAASFVTGVAMPVDGGATA
jgi:NAD(P)-dependent dehydrogenase (short-subunit alcohol dehydrogenase family)